VAFGWVSKYFKDTFIHKDFGFMSLGSVTMLSSNPLPQTTVFHEFTISTKLLPTFYFQK